MDGMFLVDKEVGYTSHDVVAIIKKKFKVNKVGHTGTLDPFATGLMIILVGKATKLSERLISAHKTYQGVMVFGTQYDTDDITGQVISEKPSHINEQEINQMMQSFVPSYLQMPPQYSAKKVDGVKSYEAARKGRTIKLTPKEVFISQFENINFENSKLTFNVDVSSGTYIRSLAHDLGEKLNTYGALESLRRTRIEKYTVNQAKTLNQLTENDLINHQVLFDQYPKLELNDYLVGLVKNGVMLDERQTNMKESFVVINQHGNYIAAYEPIQNTKQYRIFYLF